MELTKVRLKEVMDILRREVLGKKVTYCRAKAVDNAPHEMHKGEGIVTGIIIGATKRVQLLIQDKEEGKDKAWTLDELCVLPSDEDSEAYFAHHKRIKTIVDEHNQSLKDREQEKIKEVDEINYAIFGQPLAF